MLESRPNAFSRATRQEATTPQRLSPAIAVPPPLRPAALAPSLGRFTMHVWLFVLPLLLSCRDGIAPTMGPTFRGIVTVSDEPQVGVSVAGSASVCSGSRLSSAESTSTAGGAYELVLPLALGTSNICIDLVALGTEAAVSISGFRYEAEGQEYEANLDEHRLTIIVRPGGG